jgi:hypothetical protein
MLNLFPAFLTGPVPFEILSGPFQDRAKRTSTLSCVLEVASRSIRPWQLCETAGKSGNASLRISMTWFAYKKVSGRAHGNRRDMRQFWDA